MSLDLRSRPMSAVYRSETPIGDRLYDMTGGETLATWNHQRGRQRHGTGPRVFGGEWDTLRHTPLSVRRSLTTAGFMSRGGMLPDEFTDLLVRNGCRAPDPIAWYLREARMALRERQLARRHGAEMALARAHGHRTHFAYRDALAVTEGHASYWHKRKARGWV